MRVAVEYVAAAVTAAALCALIAAWVVKRNAARILANAGPEATA